MNPETGLAARLEQLAAAWLARAEVWLPDLLAATGLLLAGLAVGWLVAAAAGGVRSLLLLLLAG